MCKCSKAGKVALPGTARAAGELATLEWVARFNHHCLLEPTGDTTPVETEANDDRQLASQPAAGAV